MKKVEKVEKSQSEPLLRGLFAIFSENRRPLVGVHRGFLNVGDPQIYSKTPRRRGYCFPAIFGTFGEIGGARARALSRRKAA